MGHVSSRGGEAPALFGNEWHAFLRTFLPDGRKAGPDVPVSDSTITSLVPCGGGAPKPCRIFRSRSCGEITLAKVLSGQHFDLAVRRCRNTNASGLLLPRQISAKVVYTWSMRQCPRCRYEREMSATVSVRTP
jgi:hypothetical protein